MEDQTIGGDLAYDLRQRYAKIVGDHLEDISIARKNKSYDLYFRFLEDLYTITNHKFKYTKKSDKGNRIKEDETDQYPTLIQTVVNIANQYPNAWGGAGVVGAEIAHIETALRAVEMYLYKKMDGASMFGSKRDVEGLV